MSMNLNDYSLLPIFLVILIVIVVASEVGRWLCVRAGTAVKKIFLHPKVQYSAFSHCRFHFRTQIIVGAINGLLSYILSDSNRVLPSPLRRRIP
jgi:hypothetical protein